ncbi:hypothetical protein D3C74_447170 [compost metagenome]
MDTAFQPLINARRRFTIPLPNIGHKHLTHLLTYRHIRYQLIPILRPNGCFAFEANDSRHEYGIFSARDSLIWTESGI